MCLRDTGSRYFCGRVDATKHVASFDFCVDRIAMYAETDLVNDAADSHVYVDVVAVHAETDALSFASGNGCLRSDS